MSFTSKSEFAKAEGVTKSRVSQWVKDGLPVEGDGRIDVDKARRWLADNVARSGDYNSALNNARARKETALARLRELDVEKESGLWLRREDVKTAWQAMISAARASFLAIPATVQDSLAFETDPVKCREIIRKKIEGALEELTRFQPATSMSRSDPS